MRMWQMADLISETTGCDLEIPAGAPEFTYQIPQREINENPLISEADQNE